jgi:transposase
MSSANSKKIVRQYVGEIPILQHIAQRLGIKEILAHHIPTRGNEKVDAVDSLLLLMYNIACGRTPLYELEAWTTRMNPRMFGHRAFEKGLFSDDRFGRALDKLYGVDRASLMTEIVVNTVKSIHLQLDQVHNDSTTVKAYGKIAGKTRTGLELRKGKSKDHRPDLKQLVYCLSVSADGCVPIHYKSYSGNITDDTTHIETWNTLREIIGRADFLYVADCKVCTDKQLSYIVSQQGRVITTIPDTWGEVQQFKEEVRFNAKKRRVLMRVRLSATEHTYDTFSCFDGIYKTKKRGYPMYWIHSSRKREHDFRRRQIMLERTERELEQLSFKVNKRTLKTKETIVQRVEELLNKYKAKRLYTISIEEREIRHRVQEGRGRPGANTKYRIEVEKKYYLRWNKDRKALRREKNVDGIFPLLCTDEHIDAASALSAYKYQPRLEKRFSQFKSIHNAAPLLFKNIERVEAMMFLFFLSLILQAVIEREVRHNMKKREIDKLPIYPEHRLSYHPTTAKIFDRFCDISTYLLMEGNHIIEEFADPLNDIQLTILKLLNMSEYEYWPK